MLHDAVKKVVAQINDDVSEERLRPAGDDDNSPETHAMGYALALGAALEADSRPAGPPPLGGWLDAARELCNGMAEDLKACKFDDLPAESTAPRAMVEGYLRQLGLIVRLADGQRPTIAQPVGRVG